MYVDGHTDGKKNAYIAPAHLSDDDLVFSVPFKII